MPTLLQLVAAHCALLQQLPLRLACMGAGRASYRCCCSSCRRSCCCHPSLPSAPQHVHAHLLVLGGQCARAGSKERAADTVQALCSCNIATRSGCPHCSPPCTPPFQPAQFLLTACLELRSCSASTPLPGCTPNPANLPLLVLLMCAPACSISVAGHVLEWGEPS